jgi:hypothetical protein
MFAETDFDWLKPLFVVGFVLILIVQALFRGKQVLKETWETGEPDDLGERQNREVIGRFERGTHVPPPLPTRHVSVLPPPVPTRPAPGPAPAMSEWERELERVLRGEPAAPPPPMAPPPPPPAWIPAPSGARRFVDEESEIESAPAPTAMLATMGESALAHQRAEAISQRGATLEQRVAQHMHRVDAKMDSAAPEKSTSRRGEVSEESKAVRAWLRQHDTARAAYVAAMVFGPPKALEG